eukprot:CAMPEP_0114614616 /NCGR_PEP_ID=MMETSP0168-20121206/5746_1 /TAXON_ID=95228 ORGANISM="Vannella sp., Strain DIVA3 517/6/12" /NCGR_SAMPLE_ID=MMETSP0168 /ASSEMBLY_ACC=CAM_ASM_000044 /LENGTH=197 /DNA_ID=CAMNT_0001825671 /DNA_START=222 /DNA_END=815 /DNA_ORIENTATION=-
MRSARRSYAVGAQYAPRWAVGGVRSYSTDEAPSVDDLTKAMNTPPPLDGEEAFPPHITEIVEKVSALNMMEMMLLSKAMGAKFGVDVDAMMSGGGGFGGGGGGGGQAAPAAAVPEAEPEPEAPSSFTVRITSMEGGVKGKFAVVKILRQLKPDMSLQDCKKLLDELPAVIKENVPADEANDISEKLKASGAEVELKA